jgi:predicted nucleic acid-binding protein
MAIGERRPAVILYQDTSSVLKRYLSDEQKEPGSIEITRQAVESSEFVATAAITFPEAIGVLARARRGRRIRTNAAYTRARANFDDEWTSYIKIAVDAEIIQSAGILAESHFLKGYDAVHLASALALREQIPDSITLSTWDKELAAAALAEGLSLAHEVTS